MAKRKPIPKSVRFEVFKRDHFKCQYCGSAAPEVILHVDHITPVAGGGSDDSHNLITSCESCNCGKGARLLSDATVATKKRAEMERLAERREQLGMLVEWQDELSRLSDVELKHAVRYWERLARGWSISDSGLQTLRRHLGRFGYREVCEAMDIAARQYLRFDVNGDVKEWSWDKAWSMIGGICFNRRRSAEEGRGA